MTINYSVFNTISKSSQNHQLKNQSIKTAEAYAGIKVNIVLENKSKNSSARIG